MNRASGQNRTSANTAQRETSFLQADAGLLMMVLIWAVNFSVIKVALGDLTPLAFNALRFPLAAASVYVVLRSRGPIPLPERGDRRRILLLGVLGNVVYQLCFILGLARTRAGNAALLLAAAPIMTALLSAAVGHERVSGRAWAGVIATFAGMALVVVGGSGGADIGFRTLAGDLTLVAASAAWSAYTVGARGLIDRYGSIAVTAWTLWTGTAVLVLLGVPDLLALDWRAVRPPAWGGVAYGGMLGIAAAYLFWNNGVRRLGNTRTATYANLVPVLALLVAWLWLGEVPSAWQITGAGIIIGGITLARR